MMFNRAICCDADSKFMSPSSVSSGSMPVRAANARATLRKALGSDEKSLELAGEQVQVLGEQRHLLDGAVVQVKPEAGELALAGLDQSALGGRVAREQRFALEDRAEHRHGLLQQQARALAHPLPGRADQR